LVIKMS